MPTKRNKDEQHWLVKLDNELTDVQLLQNVNLLAEKQPDIKLHFVHVYKQEKVPDAILREIPDIHLPEEEGRKLQLQDKIDRYIKGQRKHKVKLIAGNVLSELLAYAQKHKIDLTIASALEHRDELRGINTKLARKNPAPVLLLPAQDLKAMRRVVYCTDFSPYAEQALPWAILLHQALENTRLMGMHVYHEAEHYLKGIHYSRHDIEAVMEKRQLINDKIKTHAHFKMEEVVSEAIAKGVVMEMLVIPANPAKSVAKNINTGLTKSAENLLVIAAKGQNNSAANLLGSTAEQLIKRFPHQPTLIARKKGENRKLVSALLSLWKK